METKQITPAELEKIKRLQENKGEIIVRLGQLELEELRMNKEKTTLLEAAEVVLKQEDELFGTLEKKYGSGELNVDTGIITII